jgi:hypothetical protein
VLDGQARGYTNAAQLPFRDTATSTLTVYTTRIDRVRPVMTRLADPEEYAPSSPINPLRMDCPNPLLLPDMPWQRASPNTPGTIRPAD